MDLDARLRVFDGNNDPAEDDMAWPLDYVALPEAEQPLAARPQWGTVEKILIISIITLAAVSLWIGFSWGAVHG